MLLITSNVAPSEKGNEVLHVPHTHALAVHKFEMIITLINL